MAHTAVVPLLTGALTTGDGPVFPQMFPFMVGSVQAEISPTCTACVINIMARISGNTWDTLCVLDIGEGYISGEIQPVTFPALVRDLKANIGSMTPGTLPNGDAGVSVYFAARE